VSWEELDNFVGKLNSIEDYIGNLNKREYVQTTVSKDRNRYSRQIQYYTAEKERQVLIKSRKLYDYK